MAVSDTNATSDLIEDENTVTISCNRRLVALECAWEVQKLCEVISNIVPLGDDQNFFAVRGIAARMHELSEIGMLAMSDQAELTVDLAKRLRFEAKGVAA